MPSPVSVKCSRLTEWGRCQQPASHTSGLCSAHWNWELRGGTPPRYYHEKIVRGLTQPTWDYLSDAEAHALLNGRYRGDGRRVDQYTLPEGPLGVEL